MSNTLLLLRASTTPVSTPRDEKSQLIKICQIVQVRGPFLAPQKKHFYCALTLRWLASENAMVRSGKKSIFEEEALNLYEIIFHAISRADLNRGFRYKDVLGRTCRNYKQCAVNKLKT
jgi:hypothetical protein